MFVAYLTIAGERPVFVQLCSTKLKLIEGYRWCLNTTTLGMKWLNIFSEKYGLEYGGIDVKLLSQERFDVKALRRDSLLSS